MTPSPPATSGTEEKLPRNLGLWGIWMLVVNGLIGAGIFGLPSGAAALAGEYSVLVYAFCALLILPIIYASPNWEAISEARGVRSDMAPWHLAHL